MLIRSLHIKNFRSCENVEVEVAELTAIVGANGCGKSAVLQALDLFYAANPRFSAEDFYANDTSRPIEISVTFGELTDGERDQFRRYVEGDTLTVTRVLDLDSGRSSSSLHGVRPRFAGFAEVRKKTKAGDARQAYAALRQVQSGDLPRWTNHNAALTALDQWEDEHPELCARTRDEGSFFGFKEVAQGYLGRSTRLLFVPAVRDAAGDAEDGRGTPIADLMDLVVRQSLAENTAFRELTDLTQRRYTEVFGAGNFVEIERISGGLTSTLKTYVPAAEVQVKLDATSLTLPVPRAIVRISEDGFSTTVARCGHGLQRAFILSLLQQLAAARLQPSADDSAPGGAEAAAHGEARHEPALDLVILIEEPELFQHPSRQRHFAEVLKRLASESIPGVARRVQVIYCTHSPHFVGLDRFEDIRLFRKGKGDEGRPKVSRVYSARFEHIAERIGEVFGEMSAQFGGPQFKARLGALINPRTSEGFFANVVVLVEGESDRAAILGTARSLGLHFEARGIAVIPCSGKSNVLNLAVLYKALEITTYCVWDGDGDKTPTAGTCSQCGRRLDKQPDPGENMRLLRLHGADPVDFPPQQVTDDFACFRTDLEKTIRSEIGEEAFDQALDEAKTDFGMSRRSQAIKNPALLARVLGVLRSRGHVSTTLESIVMGISKLADSYDGGASLSETVPLEVPDLVPEVQGREVGNGIAQQHVERA